MKSMNDVFNEAVDYGAEGVVPVGTPVGVEKLSHVHRVFNAVMGGGLGFAVEVLEPDDFRRAVEGFRYLDLGEVANLLAELVDSYGSSDYDVRKEEILDGLLVGALVDDAFRRKVSQAPSDFGFDGSVLQDPAAQQRQLR
ncbi:hypothetical protein AB0N38_12610 [Micromonospora aurantiaca]|nr:MULTISPECIES: hypothetical protein [Micromonospora]ADU05653.1 hypothetical protein ML5_0099 [Micromonospora sp. L5]KAB1116798.1 hypothetical protein F6X54_10480 [Micromonospora aurantiaca]MDG4755111.1 hypothetical protein [Micromonospora sp. WMMD718]UFN94691.1 hypothetical protein LF814_00515 [Micromonospora aurantiaca]SCL39297.1 hypothetical protein GA0070615_3997 [Micromonospora aurantiaca]